MSDPLAELRETFFLECDELLEKLETDLLALESGVEDEELVNSAFRAVHSIKGGAGAFGMTAITDSSHIFETAMDHVRSGELKLDPELCALFLRGKDLLAALISHENGGPPADEAEMAAVKEAFEAVTPEEEELDADAIFQPVAIELPGAGGDGPTDPMDILAQFESGADDDEGGAAGFDLPDFGPKGEIVVAFGPKTEFFVRGNDAAPFIRELRDLGEAEVMVDASRLPDFDDLDPAASYLEWTICLDPSVSEADIEEIFDFVAEDCDISIGESLGLAGDAPAANEPEAQVFIDFEAEAESLPQPETGTDADDALEHAAEVEIEPTEQAAEGEATPEPVVASADAGEDEKPEADEQDDEPKAPAVAQAQAPRAQTAPKPVVRVELSRVDRLINLVSELVISQSMLSQAIEDNHSSSD
ncbi:MAG: Hpt domain-containing protein, partial [Planctomycetota bacterium]